MHPDRKAQLKERQKQANELLEIKDFLTTTVNPALELIGSIPHTPIELVETLYIKPEWKDAIRPLLTKQPYAAFRFADVPLLPDNGRLHHVFDQFGDTLPLRYVPELPIFANQFDEKEDVIQRMSIHLGCEEELVYLHHLRYAVVWKLRLSDLITVNHDILFNPSEGDAIIFTESQSWLMSYSLEEQWYAGRKSTADTNGK